MTLYLDMDGVFADFDGAVKKLTGKMPSDLGDEQLWEILKNTPNFYASIEPLPDAQELWDFCKNHFPIFLTGIPREDRGMKTASDDKKSWARKHYHNSRVITCHWKEKATYCEPGDILVDDRKRQWKLWAQAGGIFIHHRNAKDTIEALQGLENL